MRHRDPAKLSLLCPLEMAFWFGSVRRLVYACQDLETLSEYFRWQQTHRGKGIKPRVQRAYPAPQGGNFGSYFLVS